jgi:hypothetical protein
MLLARWWAELHENKEICSTFSEEALPLPGFYKVFENAILTFEADNEGIWFACWCSPSLSGAFFSLWIAKRRRKSKLAYYFTMKMYEKALAIWPVLLGITKQPKLLKEHEKLGYEILGKIPSIWDGDPAWLVVLTEEGFYGKRNAMSSVSGRVGRGKLEPISPKS